MKNKKFIFTVGFLLGFQAFTYWFLKFFQNNYHYIDFFLDKKIPFIGEFIYIYDLFYPFVFFALFLLFCDDEKTYYKSIISGSIGFLICDIIFLVYPTVMLRPDVSNYGGLTGLILKYTYLFDTPALNCFPSIHCLFSFNVMFGYLFSKNIISSKKLLVSIVSLSIALSTLFVKQHYIYDFISALLICSVCYFITYRFKLYEKYLKDFFRL